MSRTELLNQAARCRHAATEVVDRELSQALLYIATELAAEAEILTPDATMARTD